MNRDLPPTGPMLQSPPRAETVRFTYGSGDRPLAGYTIKRGIGRGGFGEVYYGLSDGGKEVALKLVQRNLEVELRGVGQCLNLKHHNLVALYDVKQSDGGDYWVVMEYVAGKSLAGVIDANPNGMPPEEALHWAAGLCAGIAYLHDRGIVHRDLKPANIFMEDGVVKIGDYGLAKFITTSRRSGQTESVGTVHYMAPEISNGRYGKEIDVYAAGIMLYEMLTGEVPFEGESVGEILMKHLTAQPDLSGLAEPYRGIVACALAKDPQRRYASTGEMLEELTGQRPAGAVTAQRPPLPVSGPIDLSEKDLVASPQLGRRPFPPGAKPGVWAAFLREDPLLRRLRDLWSKISPNNPAQVLAVVLLLAIMLSTPLFVVPLCALAYFGVALAIRWLQSLSATGTPHARLEAPVRQVRQADGPAAPPSPALPRSQPHPAASARPLPRERPRNLAAKLIAFPVGVVVLATVLLATFGVLRTDVQIAGFFATGFAASLFAALIAYPFFLWWAANRQPAHTSMIGVRRSETGSRASQPPATLRRKLTELTGSMLAVFPVVLLLCFLLGTIRPSAAITLAVLGEVGAIGALVVLLVAKWWDGREGDPWIRRGLMLVAGLFVGAAAWTLDESLWINWDASRGWPAAPGPLWFARDGAAQMLTPGGQPTLLLYLAYFGMLYFLIPWWRLTDPARHGRLMLGRAVLLPAAIAYVLCFVWPFPQPWGLIWAVMIAVSVQLVSPRKPQDAQKRE